jgi:S-adenosylmethionine:tRNA ribosyltransferase-isomerase
MAALDKLDKSGKDLNLDDYDYHLPQEMIAQKAFHPRDHCKLLVLKDNRIEHKTFFQIIDYLQQGDILVLNETKVQHCKLLGKKETGAKVEVTIVRPAGKVVIAPIGQRGLCTFGNQGMSARLDYTSSTRAPRASDDHYFKDLVYETRIKGNKLKPGHKLLFKNNQALIIHRDDDIFYLKFKKPLKTKDLQILTPPYIKAKVPEKDYQTVFANKLGSLAAPTAGLHFTNSLLKKIERKGVKIAKLQLDISFETFLPVRDPSTHKTGREYFELDQHNADIINSNPKNIIAVGTTVVKCLESCRWEDGKIMPTKDFSEIFIKPGYQFRSPIKAMLINFHLPRSSLLLLTATFAGRERLLRAYGEAVKNDYRFFSLGDAMVIFKE